MEERGVDGGGAGGEEAFPEKEGSRKKGLSDI